MSRDIEIDDLQLVAATDRALLVRLSDVDEEDATDGENQWWIPRSQLVSTDLDQVGDIGYIEIPEWLAREKGLE